MNPNLSPDEKIKSLNELRKILTCLKDGGKRIVHCHGVFDLVHPGHIRHLERAKREGDILVVTVTPDEYVNKGPGRPVFNQRLRTETLAALQCIDYVAINEWPAAVETIRLLKPDVYVKGNEYAIRENDLTGKIGEEEEAVKSVGGRIYFTEQDMTFSSSRLLNEHFGTFSPETHAYLDKFRKQYLASDVIDRLKSLADLKVLVVGDAIIDEYHFCQPYGMASKSSTIAARFLNAEAYAGGALAVANHLAGFSGQVHLITCLGEQDSREEFVTRNLKPKVSAKFFFRPDAPTIVKRRYVQGYLVTKLFEVGFFSHQQPASEIQKTLCQYLAGVIQGYDLVVVADFGHGLIGPAVVDLLCKQARFLAVNCQTNSVNLGYNVINKYPRAHYICLDEEEVRLACGDQHGSLKSLIEQITENLNCPVMAVTRGYRNSMIHERDNGFFEIPVFSREVVDTLGAGDAFLSITAACASKGYPAELIGFVGNAVGALAVRIIGNKEPVTPLSLFRFITTLLK